MSAMRHTNPVLHALLALTSAVALLMSMSACGAPAASEPSNGPGGGSTNVTFMLAWTPDTNHIGVYVAKAKGYFKTAGLNVNIIAVSQNGAEHAVSTGVADFALSNLTNAADYNLKGAGIKLILQVQQKPSAIWCSLTSNQAITRPRDFDGKTFATFGTNESDAVIRRMIRADGGKGVFDKVTVGTSTFQTLSTGKADFGGFYSTWEGVQAEMHGPRLRCFREPDYGVPGNADTIGVITSNGMIAKHPQTVRAFTQAAQQGYEYAYAHPDEAADILVKAASDVGLERAFVRRSMHTIVDGQYWGDRKAITDGSFTFGTPDLGGAQRYFDFLAQSGAYTDSDGHAIHRAPKVSDSATGEFLAGR